MRAARGRTGDGEVSGWLQRRVPGPKGGHRGLFHPEAHRDLAEPAHVADDGPEPRIEVVAQHRRAPVLEVEPRLAAYRGRGDERQLLEPGDLLDDAGHVGDAGLAQRV